MAITTTKFDITEHLDTEEAVAAYLSVVFEEGDLDEIKAAIGHVAKARGMSAVASKAGMSRGGLYKALGESGNPTLSGLLGIMHAFGVRLAVTVESDHSEAVAA